MCYSCLESGNACCQGVNGSTSIATIALPGNRDVTMVVRTPRGRDREETTKTTSGEGRVFCIFSVPHRKEQISQIRTFWGGVSGWGRKAEERGRKGKRNVGKLETRHQTLYFHKNPDWSFDLDFGWLIRFPRTGWTYLQDPCLLKKGKRKWKLDIVDIDWPRLTLQRMGDEESSWF